MNVIRSTDLYILVLAVWWAVWLSVSSFGYGGLVRPSGVVLGQFLLLLSAFLYGGGVARLLFAGRRGQCPQIMMGPSRGTSRGLLFLGVLCLLVILFSLYLSGGFSMSFEDYHLKLRFYGLEDTLTGMKYLDLFLKLFVYPFSFFLMIYSLAIKPWRVKFLFPVAVVSLVSFSYLWQVNYPLVHVFWVILFSVWVGFKVGYRVDKKHVLIIVASFVVLVFAAVNRFSGDLAGALDRYFLGYHVIGFSYYDYHYKDSYSILHDHSFGRSSLGFIEQFFDLLLRFFGSEYKAASFENIDFNVAAIDLGESGVRNVNAFGTILFSFYRDFNYFGIIFGGFLYGLFVVYSFLACSESWRFRAVVLVLAPAWMIGMMVSPLEQPYFWFSVLCVFIVPNRVVKNNVS